MSLLNIEHIHQDYTIPKHFLFWKQGGYSDIYKFYNEILKIVPKVIKDKDTEEDIIQHTSITEVAISQYLPKDSYFIDCHHIYTNQNSYFIYQDYKGSNLTYWKNNTPIEKRIQDMPHIIHQLLTILIFLEEHGIYYTDLRPCNLLWEYQKLTLIDYSCISLQYCYKDSLQWTPAIGTWNYAAPEIIFNSSVVSNSVIWSVAMIICELLDDYPIQKKYYPNYKIKITNNHAYWLELLHKIYNQEQQPIAFVNSYQSLSQPWKEWIIKMMHWNSTERITKQKLLQEISTTFNITPFIIPYKLATSALPYHRKNYRFKYLNKLYNFAESIDQLYKVCLTIYIWDLYTLHMDSKNEINILCASWLLTGYLMGQYAYDEDTTIHLYKHFKTNYKKVYPYIWKIGEKCYWNLYQKSTDIYLLEHYKCVPWKPFLKFYSDYTENYSTFQLSQAFIQANPTI
jgi:serine/threonine protein kinase